MAREPNFYTIVSLAEKAQTLWRNGSHEAARKTLAIIHEMTRPEALKFGDGDPMPERMRTSRMGKPYG